MWKNLRQKLKNLFLTNKAHGKISSQNQHQHQLLWMHHHKLMDSLNLTTHLHRQSLFLAIWNFEVGNKNSIQKAYFENKLERLNHHQNWNQWQQTNHFVQKCLNNGPLIEALLVSRTFSRHFVKSQCWILAAKNDFGLKYELGLSETVKSVNKELNWIHSVEHFVWIKVTSLFLDLFKLPNVVVATSDSLWCQRDTNHLPDVVLQIKFKGMIFMTDRLWLEITIHFQSRSGR